MVDSWYIILDLTVHLVQYEKDGKWHMGSDLMQLRFPSDELNFVLVF